MIKAYFAKFKVYIIVLALLGLVIGTWKVRGWYEDGKVKTALIKQREAYEEQAALDAKALLKSLDTEQALRAAYRSIRDEANKTKLCANGGADFHRLFNRGATAANTTQ